MGSLYEEDFAVWATATARLLREGRLAEIDAEHVAEEIEDMGKSQQREVSSRLRILLIHLLKWRLQPGKRSRSWKSTIAAQRDDLRDLFRQSPSLKAALPKVLAEVYPDAVARASIETELPAKKFPGECPFSPQEILNRDFLPS